jgi:hypothetical protein
VGAPEAVAARPDEANLTLLIEKANALLIGHSRAKVVDKIKEATRIRPKAKAKAKAKPVMKARRGLHAPIAIRKSTATVSTQRREKTNWIANPLP